jgi:protein ImuB
VWACIRFPHWPLQALGDVDETRPCAVVEGQSPRRRIAFANAAAQATGVRAGHTLAAAQALCPQLKLRLRDEAAERRRLETLAAWAYRFSADVSLAPPDALLLEVGRSLSLFGGWPALERRLRSELTELGCPHRLAAAPNATAARVLASRHDGLAIAAAAPLQHALGALPLAAGGLDEAVVAALGGMGFRTLRELFRLPRAELARRAGPAALDHLDRLRGQAAEQLVRYRPPDRYERRLELNHGIESSTALLFPLRRLLAEFALFLVARDGGVQRFAVVLGHERAATTRIEIGLLTPARDAATLFELARTRLERVELPAAVHAVTLRADELPPLCPLHRDLFDRTRAQALDWPALVERLRARLGDDSVHGLACVAEHRPERAWRFAAADAAAGSAARPAPRREEGVASAAVAPRPFWLLPRPLPLRPAPAAILAGPERIESGWWDGDDRRRDYYLVRTRAGQRAWAFVDVAAGEGWMLHGWFA